MAARVELKTKALKFIALIAASETDVQTTAAENVEHRDLLRDEQRMMQREDNDGGAYAQSGRLGRKICRELRRT